MNPLKKLRARFFSLRQVWTKIVQAQPAWWLPGTKILNLHASSWAAKEALMLLTQPLPPHFLLPAWSARQLASAVQRAHLSDVPDTSPLRTTRNARKEPAELLISGHTQSGPIPKQKWGYNKFAENSLGASRAKETAGENKYSLDQSGSRTQGDREPETRGSIADYESEADLKVDGRWQRFSNFGGYNNQIARPGLASSTEQSTKLKEKQQGLKIRWTDPYPRRSILRYFPKDDRGSAQLGTKEHDSIPPKDERTLVSHRKLVNFYPSESLFEPEPAQLNTKEQDTTLQQRKSGFVSPRNSTCAHPSNPLFEFEDTRLEIDEQDVTLSNNEPSSILDRKVQSESLEQHSSSIKGPNNPIVKEAKREQCQSEAKKAQKKPRLSLFEELFPELTLEGNTKRREALDNLARLPAFEWKTSNAADPSGEAKSDAYHDIPKRDPSIIGRETSKPHIARRYGPLREDEPSVLVLNASSAQLEESDFFRQGSKGEHIEGWTSGIIKVIPAREEETLRFKGHYFLLFSSDAAARAYLDQTIRLHTLSRWRGIDKDAFIPAPPGYLKEGEDIDVVLRNFSLVPGHSKLSLRMINRPYAPSMKRTLRYGGPVAAASQQAKTEHLVLFHLDVGHISLYDLRLLLKDDGNRRNLHWKVAGGYDNIFKVEGKMEGDREEKEVVAGKPQFKPARYVVPFVDQQEARRFIREWHRQPLAIQKEHKVGNELPSIVNAELIW